MNLVSVIIPFYKKKKYFKKTLSSIINQSYKKLEIFIIYDDTNKEDLEFLKKQSKADKRIKLVINKKNMGAGFSRNKGIELSKGKFIAFIDSDDIWKKNKISLQLDFMIRNNFDATHTDYKIISSENKYLGYRKARNINEIRDILKSCDIGLSSVIIKKSKIKKNIKFPDLKTKEDFIFWIRLLKNKVKFKSLNKCLMIWTETKNSLSSSTSQKLSDGFKVYNTYLKFNFFKSCLYLFLLSFNYLLKKNVKLSFNIKK